MAAAVPEDHRGLHKATHEVRLRPGKGGAFFVTSGRLTV